MIYIFYRMIDKRVAMCHNIYINFDRAAVPVQGSEQLA